MSDVSLDRSSTFSVPFGTPRPIDADLTRERCADERVPAGEQESAAESLGAMLHGLPATDLGALLLSLTEHAATLRLIADAHAGGFLDLPPSLAERVGRLGERLPTFLGAPGLA